jgi:Cys-tRNA(Pro) deacylase
MSDAIKRVQRFLADHDLEVEIITFDVSVHTAQQAAEALRTSVQHIVKSLVFEADGRPVLVLCGGDRRVDTARLAALCGVQQVRKASAELTRRVTGYSIGGVPPVAHATPLPVFMDEALLSCDTVYAAAGTARALFAIAPQVLKEVSKARVVMVGEVVGAGSRG